VSEPVTRRELDLLKNQADREHSEIRHRLDVLDTGGTRGILALQVQVTDLIKDVTELRVAVKDHTKEHETEERARVVSRRWVITAVIAALAVVEGPIGYIIVHLH
jgi:hypothetical protein